ncbi:MAG: hypothetical protein DLM70_09125 [Chloroflexi bacterium]|nr:MAG: hypothetical protein DLM70_09125 [Chloroflexota bacterium]
MFHISGLDRLRQEEDLLITWCDELRVIFDSLGRGKSYGESTTHMWKLLPKVEGGGVGCPLLVFGISDRLYVKD